MVEKDFLRRLINLGEKLWYQGEDFKNGEQYSGRVHKPSYPELDFSEGPRTALGLHKALKRRVRWGFMR